MKKLTIFSCLLFIYNITFSQVNDILMLKTNGKVVIGDTTQISTPGNYNLYVQNGILTERVKVSLRNTGEWSDNSFSKTPSLSEMEASINSNSHLIDMPSAETLVKEGYEIKNMDAKLLQQIEWLWQHTIQLQKENEVLKSKVSMLVDKIEKSEPRK